jgi:hypothetical protein
MLSSGLSAWRAIDRNYAIPIRKEACKMQESSPEPHDNNQYDRPFAATVAAILVAAFGSYLLSQARMPELNRKPDTQILARFTLPEEERARPHSEGAPRNHPASSKQIPAYVAESGAERGLLAPRETLAQPYKSSGVYRSRGSTHESLAIGPSESGTGDEKRGQSTMERVIFGKDIQHARARPSPNTRYNPALHERPEDLAPKDAENAWQSAPIAETTPPGLHGEASHAIRIEVSHLEQEIAGCNHSDVAALFPPLLSSLQNLGSAEVAMSKGADPIRAAHSLPNEIYSHYNQCRRVIWHIRSKLSACKKP